MSSWRDNKIWEVGCYKILPKLNAVFAVGGNTTDIDNLLLKLKLHIMSDPHCVCFFYYNIPWTEDSQGTYTIELCHSLSQTSPAVFVHSGIMRGSLAQ